MAQPIKSTQPQPPCDDLAAPAGTRSAAAPAGARVVVITPKPKSVEIPHSLDAISTRATEAFNQIEAGLSNSYRWAVHQSEEAVRRARIRARHLCNEYPLHVIAAAAGTAFVIGILLRIGRSGHESN
jgi:ElaB/YqjD/DUF883 family membrane-anchored ribosome-binding protein